jgi:ATP-dependent Clp protease ATP-binding subunit ClpC
MDVHTTLHQNMFELSRKAYSLCLYRRSLVFERYNDQARIAIVSTVEEARALKHSYVGPEHLLLGIIHDPRSLAIKVLESLGVELDVVRQKVMEMTGEGSAESDDNVPFTPRAKEVLGLALREALVLGHQHIGTEHLLLGLIREEEGVAAHVLIEQGAYLEIARQQVVMVLAGQQVSQ